MCILQVKTKHVEVAAAKVTKYRNLNANLTLETALLEARKDLESGDLQAPHIKMEAIMYKHEYAKQLKKSIATLSG
jgi:hypothetical protein